jgi:OOP family OmpA-OmpF porin
MDSIFVIYFDLDSNALSAKAKGKLDRVADLLLKNPNVEVTLNGYTDSYGDPSYNQVVSEGRAGMVKAYLVGKGVDPAKIEAVGYGPQKFMATNKTREGRRLNRRVEIEVSNMTR